jgi:protein phosphatase
MQAANGVVSRENIDKGLYAGDSCEDSVMSRPDKALFGVFDGAGGMGHGRDASSFAAEALANISDNYDINSAQDLADSLRLVQRNMAQRGVEGMTTATVAKLLRRQDGYYAAYVSVGDSRMYLVHEDGTADLITQDEGFENQITNCLSSGYGYSGVKQFGEVKLRRGDKIVLCSDGITGDKGSDLMSEAELGSIVARSTSSEDASKNLITGARKRDDRTALVIGEF